MAEKTRTPSPTTLKRRAVDRAMAAQDRLGDLMAQRLRYEEKHAVKVTAAVEEATSAEQALGELIGVDAAMRIVHELTHSDGSEPPPATEQPAE